MPRPVRKQFECEALRLEHFVNRERHLERAREVLTTPAGEALPILVFCGMGGVGK